MKIIFVNFQSGMFIVKSHMQYMTSGWKYILPHDSYALESLVNFINIQNPDIVFFAEIDGCSWRSKKMDQVAVIADRTHLKYSVFFSTRTIGAWINQGSAICARFPLKNKEQLKLPGFGERRYLCGSVAVVGSQEIQCYTTHLSTNAHVNIAQRHFIAKKLHTRNDSMILAGDFNIERDQLKIIRNNTHLNDIDFDPTYPSWHPKNTLDHIFVSNDYAIKNSITYKDEHFSDHLPIGVHVDKIKQ